MYRHRESTEQNVTLGQGRGMESVPVDSAASAAARTSKMDMDAHRASGHAPIAKVPWLAKWLLVERRASRCRPKPEVVGDEWPSARLVGYRLNGHPVAAPRARCLE